MDHLACLIELTSQMQFEPDTEHDDQFPVNLNRIDKALNIAHATLPNGQRIPLLKTLLTSACERDCNYCAFRSGRDFRRSTLKPDELARAFLQMQIAGIVEGLFLSSGIAGGGQRTQDTIIATAEILRQKYRFTGYLHLKIMPGAEYDQIKRTMQLADRVSINLEAPNPERLAKLAPHKSFFDELVSSLQWIDAIRVNSSPQGAFKNRWPSVSTQFVIGAAGESDLEILQMTDNLNRGVHLNRAYFSAFSPVAGTPLEDLPPAEYVRQRRLYQASFLLRDYGFELEDLPFDHNRDLPTRLDPKLAWARQNLRDTPVEINRADRHELLRVPGIGPKGASAILRARRRCKFTSIDELKSLGLNIKRLQPFVTVAGRKPAGQLSFWAVD